MAEKKSLSAREVVADIRVGMSDEQLMGKHGLSTKGLQSLKDKLITAGLLTAQELNGTSPSTQAPDPSADKRAFAKSIADAVKNGLSDPDVVKRFGISVTKLPKAYESLIKAGYLTQEDLTQRGNGEGFEQTVDLAPDDRGSFAATSQSKGRDLLRSLGDLAGGLISEATGMIKEKSAQLQGQESFMTDRSQVRPFADEKDDINPGSVGANKECPFCGELVLAKAKKCKHCGEILDVAMRAAGEAGRAAGAQQQVVIMPGGNQPHKPFPHIRHLIMTLFTGGLWSIIWIISYLKYRDRR